MIPLQRAQIPQIYQQALTLQKRGDLDAAEKRYRTILGAEPTLAEAHFRLAQIALTRGDARSGVPHLESALKSKPGEAPIWQLAIQLFSALDERQRVLAAYDRLIAMSPKDVKPRADKALYLQSIGEFSAAERILRSLLKRDPYSGELFRILLGGKKVSAGDPLIADMTRAFKHPRQTALGRMHLGFALAKAMEDSGQTNRVFEYLNVANQIQRETYPPDLDAAEVERRAVLSAQTGAAKSSVKAEGGPTPVFVTGMPRSGTTLVEQILGAHSCVATAGELGLVLRLAYGRFGMADKMTPLPDITDKQLIGFANEYRAGLRRAAGADAQMVTDKSIKTELVFGLCHAAMPDAKIIVVQRDPRDIALSIYKNFFPEGRHRYANDFNDIAHGIHAFRQSVAFWKERLPGVIHEIQYEDLVAEPEPNARALIAAAGLAWEDDCLNFHKQKGVVKTLSLHQVRQPIHAGRRQAWRKYEADMQPFVDAWEAKSK